MWSEIFVLINDVHDGLIRACYILYNKINWLFIASYMDPPIKGRNFIYQLLIIMFQRLVPLAILMILYQLILKKLSIRYHIVLFLNLYLISVIVAKRLANFLVSWKEGCNELKLKYVFLNKSDTFGSKTCKALSLALFSSLLFWIRYWN